MKLLKRLRDLKVLEDTLEGLEARKSVNKKLAFLFIFCGLILTLVSLCHLMHWTFKYSPYTPAATIGMRAIAATSCILFLVNTNVLSRLAVNLIGKSPPLPVLCDMISLLNWTAFLERILAVLFVFVVLPHQVTSQEMSNHYDATSSIARWYWYTIPSLYGKFFYFRTAAYMLTFSLVDSFVQYTVDKEDRMREIMDEDTIRSPPMRTSDSSSESDDGTGTSVQSINHRNDLPASRLASLTQLAKGTSDDTWRSSSMSSAGSRSQDSSAPTPDLPAKQPDSLDLKRIVRSIPLFVRKELISRIRSVATGKETSKEQAAKDGTTDEPNQQVFYGPENKNEGLGVTEPIEVSSVQPSSVNPAAQPVTDGVPHPFSTVLNQSTTVNAPVTQEVVVATAAEPTDAKVTAEVEKEADEPTLPSSLESEDQQPAAAPGSGPERIQ